MGGISAALSKTFIAPIERVKLLLQNQSELLKQSRINRPYAGVGDVIARVVRNEGVWALWCVLDPTRNLCRSVALDNPQQTAAAGVKLAAPARTHARAAAAVDSRAVAGEGTRASAVHDDEQGRPECATARRCSGR